MCLDRPECFPKRYPFYSKSPRDNRTAEPRVTGNQNARKTKAIHHHLLQREGGTKGAQNISCKPHAGVTQRAPEAGHRGSGGCARVHLGTWGLHTALLQDSAEKTEPSPHQQRQKQDTNRAESNGLVCVLTPPWN